MPSFKKSWRFVTFLLIFGLMSYIQTSKAFADDYGNSIGAAQGVSYNSNSLSINGNIETAGDIDYFKIYVSNASTTKPATIDIYTTGSTNTYGYLYSPSESILQENNDGSGTYGTNFHIQKKIYESGMYYFAVKHASATGTGAYTLKSNYTPDDYGDGSGAATQIAYNSQTPGTFELDYDIDALKIQIPSAGKINLYTTGTTDTQALLLNPSYQIVASNSDGGGQYGQNFFISYNAPIGGTYYILLLHQTYSTGNYVLNSSFTLATDDHGNTPAIGVATEVNSTTVINGNIETAGDKDVFHFITPANTQSVLAYTSGSTDTYGKLYGKILLTDNDGGAQYGYGKNFRINALPQAAPSNSHIYIEVSHNSPNGMGPYTLHIQTVSAQ